MINKVGPLTNFLGGTTIGALAVYGGLESRPYITGDKTTIEIRTSKTYNKEAKEEIKKDTFTAGYIMSGLWFATFLSYLRDRRNKKEEKGAETEGS